VVREEGEGGGGASAARHHAAGGGRVSRCHTRLSKGRGSVPTAAGPGGGERRLGRQGRARSGGGLVWHVGLRKKWAQP
jgi:hypothetical protein